MKIDNLTIAVCCNKKDFFMAKICVASIRYYYPDIALEIIKDVGNGDFDTIEIEKCFSVKNIDFGISNMGWSGAKFHYLYNVSKGKKVLLLDADIVFIGPFLERLLSSMGENDYLVSIEEEPNPYADWVRFVYFDVKKIESHFPDYKFPGFFFNAGQIFTTTGAIHENILNQFFDPDNYPYWKNKDLFPLVDQSVYNYLLPVLEAEKKIKLGKEKFMIWAKSEQALNMQLEALSEKTLEIGLIHWAGCLRFNYVSKMVRGDILVFFENLYYEKLRAGTSRRITLRIIHASKYYLKQLYYKVKRFYKLRKSPNSINER